LQKRIYINFSILILFCVLLLAGLFSLLFFNATRAQEMDGTRNKAYLLAAMINQGVGTPSSNGTTRITLISPSGAVVYDSHFEAEALGSRADREEVMQAFLTGFGESVRYSRTLSSYTFYYAIMLENGYVLRLSRTLYSLGEVFTIIMPTLVIITIIVMTIAYAITRTLTSRIISPLSKIGLNDNDYDYNDKDFYEELRPYVQQINSQKQQMATQLNLRREFSANVSHELKTPLTSISALSEMMANNMVKTEDIAQFSSKISSHARRLINVIEDIIRLSEFDESKVEREFTMFDVFDLAKSVISALQDKADEKHVVLELLGEPLQLTANNRLIDELLFNLVDNGIKYNKEGGSVTIGISKEEGWCKISVADTGIGIPEEHQSRIFERFYRVDNSRSKRTGGTGLGLSIVKHITEHHNGKISLQSTERVGTTIDCYITLGTS